MINIENFLCKHYILRLVESIRIENTNKNMSFVNAMDLMTVTENGAPAHSTTSSTNVDLFFKAVRSANLSELIDKVTSEFKNENDKVDFIVLAFQTRGTRGIGKGEKELFRQFLRKIHSNFGNDVINAILPLIPHYGCWKDIVNIYIDPYFSSNIDVKIACAKLITNQIKEDNKIIKTKGNNAAISLVAKYVPRQNCHADKVSDIFSVLTKEMFKEADMINKKNFRKMISNMSSHLKVVEQLMSAGKWNEIDPSKVPSLALDRYRKVFMNESLKGICPPHMEDTGNRHPYDANRVALRKSLRESITTKGIQGKQLFPHEIVKKCMNGNISTMEKDLLNAMWIKMRDGVTDVISNYEKQITSNTSNNINLGKLIPLSDVSGSMHGTPMEVSIALGILISEVTDANYRDRILTFESNPNWVTLNSSSDIFTKVQTVMRAGWGGSTNFQAACERILNVAETNKLEPDKIPDLIVFSDMQFDQANGNHGYYGYNRSPHKSWDTNYNILIQRFAEVGTKICGKPYRPPKIIFWNLRGNTDNFPVTSDTPNVQMLSGFSPSLLKLLLTGVEINNTSNTSTVTPMQTYLAAINDNAFDLVRMKLSDMTTGVFANYKFIPPDNGDASNDSSNGQTPVINVSNVTDTSAGAGTSASSSSDSNASNNISDNSAELDVKNKEIEELKKQISAMKIAANSKVTTITNDDVEVDGFVFAS